jgi:hypothetical protein
MVKSLYMDMRYSGNVLYPLMNQAIFTLKKC